jgi:hypothetical protein
MMLLGVRGAGAGARVDWIIWRVVVRGDAEGSRDRIALGASGSSVVGMVVRHGLALMGIGIAIGLAGSWAATRSLKNLLYGVPATDPIRSKYYTRTRPLLTPP